MTREEYLEDILSHIKDKRAKIEVKKELEAHLDDRMAFYTDAGYDEDYALSKTIERMGNADEIGEKLSGVHNTDMYRNVAKIFIVLYGLGIILGAVLTALFIFRVLDLSEFSDTVCLLSVMVFLYSSLAFFYTQKSKDEGLMIIYGGISLLNFFAAPLTFLPCGFSILSLIFQFPCSIVEDGMFDFFYYPFDSTILDFFNVSDTVDSAFYIILWIFMCAFAFFPIISGLVSFMSYLRIGKENSDSFFKKANRYAVLLLIISIIGTVSITAEVAVNTIVLRNAGAQAESQFDFDFYEGWKEFNSISLPISIEEAKEKAIQNGSIYTEEEIDEHISDVGMLDYYSNIWCEIILDCEPDKNGNYNGNFYSKRFLNLHDADLNHEDFNKLRKLKSGATEEDIWEILPPKYLDSCTVEVKDNKETIELEYANPETEEYILIILEDGVLIQVLEDGEDIL